MPRGRRRAGSPELRPVEDSPQNDLNDEQKAALFNKGIDTLEDLGARIEELVGRRRSQRKIMKTEGFNREEIDYALWLRKAGEEGGRERMAAHIRVADWLGKPLGFQASFDLKAAQ